MGDAGEGLIDADAKIQERMEELRLSRAQSRRPAVKNPEQVREIESLKLAHTEMTRQLENTTTKRGAPRSPTPLPKSTAASRPRKRRSTRSDSADYIPAAGGRR